ncbi:MAG: hypothetical protein MUF84_08570 [Anaerolineae bacterium]|nr:hypothetical protein [Anaerolineae bacterium]
MPELTSQTVYFTETGSGNTDRTLHLVAERAKSLGIRTVLVATTSGATGVRATELLTGLDVVAVTHSAGFQTPFVFTYDPANIERIKAAGARVLTTTHAFGGVGRAVRKKLNTYQVDEIMAFTLRTFGQGMKVAAEITLMASDGGLLPDGSPIIAVRFRTRGRHCRGPQAHPRADFLRPAVPRDHLHGRARASGDRIRLGSTGPRRSRTLVQSEKPD